MSWDIKSGYHHFYIHPDMSDFFVYVKYDRCIEPASRWGLSPPWFQKMMRKLVQDVAERCSYCVLSNIGDFLIARRQPGLWRLKWTESERGERLSG